MKVRNLTVKSSKMDLLTRVRRYEAIFQYLNIDVSEILGGASVDTLCDLRQQLIEVRDRSNNPSFTVESITDLYRRAMENKERGNPAAQQLFSLRDIAEFIAIINYNRGS